jgi:hypothetical protein
MSRLFMLGAIGSAGGTTYWIGGFQGTSSTTISPSKNGAHIADDGSLVVCAYDESSGSAFYRISQTGRLLWQKTISSYSTTTNQSAAVSPDSNYLLIGSRDTATTGAAISYMPYPTPTSVSWARGLNSTDVDYLARGLFDSSGNPYLIMQGDPVNSSSIEGTAVAKFNTSGTRQWIRTLYNTNRYAVFCNDACIDTSNSVHVCGAFLEIAPGTSDIIDFYIAKISSTGAVSWQARLTGTDLQSYNEYHRIITDSSNNVYAAGYGYHSASAPEQDIIIVKYNSSGSLQWQRRFSGSGSTGYTEVCRGIAVKSDQSLLLATMVPESSTLDNSYILNYNSSGTLLWQRRLSNFEVYDMVLDDDDNMYVVGLLGRYHFCVLKLPADGTKTGTYTLFGSSTVYSAGSGTQLTSSFSTVTSPTVTTSTSTTLSQSSLSQTISDVSRTYTKVGIA